MLLYRSIESKESVGRRMYLRSVAAVKLAEQQKLALEDLKVRLQNQPQSHTNLLTLEQGLVSGIELDDMCAGELSVGEFLKQRMFKRVGCYRFKNYWIAQFCKSKFIRLTFCIEMEFDRS